MIKLKKALEAYARAIVIDAGCVCLSKTKWPKVFADMAATHPREWAHIVAVKDGKAMLVAVIPEQGATESKVELRVFSPSGNDEDAQDFIEGLSQK